MRDVDDVATDFPDLKFVIDHCGIPRIDDFCWIANQEPNVYGGLSVVSAFIHARPRYFASLMADLLFFLGPDRLIFGSDYAIHPPEMDRRAFRQLRVRRRDRARGRHGADPRRQGEDPRPQRREALRHPGAGRMLPAATQRRSAGGGVRRCRWLRTDRVGALGDLSRWRRPTSQPPPSWAALDTVLDPELDESVVVARLRRRGRGRRCGGRGHLPPADRMVLAELRLDHGRGHAGGASPPGLGRADRHPAGRPFRGRAGSTPASPAAAASPTTSARKPAATSRRCARPFAARHSSAGCRP